MDRESGKVLEASAHRGRWQKIAGIALAVMGFFWLAKRAGWMAVEHGHSAVFWPLVVVAIGLLLFFGREHRSGSRTE